MIGILSQILGSFGLSAASGLNAYIPLLVVALTARFTPWLHLSPPFDALTNEWVIATLIVLELIEMFVDKIPGLDHLNDLIQTLIRPAAGAILFAANAHVITNLNPSLAIIAGLLTAFSVHATKAVARPVVTVGTLGLGNWAVSILEDIISLFVSVIAILVPFLLVIVLLVFILLALRWLSRRTRPAAVAPPPKPSSVKWPRY